MKGMSGAFVQAKVGMALRRAVANSEPTTEYDKDVVMSFLSGGSSSETDYVPKSGEIVGILKQMKSDFEKSLADVEAEESDQVKVYDELMAAKTKQVEALTAAIEKKSVKIGELQVSIVTMKNDLTETEAALIADKKFIADLDKTCETKKAEMEQRVKIRGEELVAIQDTIKILNDDDALAIFKKTLPSTSFVQQLTNVDALRNKAFAIVREMRN